MKKLSLVLIMILMSLFAVAQKSEIDVVYLKNGTVVKGRILEQIPDKSVKMYTSNRSIVEFKMEEIERMDKEKGTDEILSTSQFTQGDFIVGTNFKLLSTRFNYINAFDSTGSRKGFHRLSAIFGYFILDNLELGANFSIDFNKTGGTNIGIGPQIRFCTASGFNAKLESSYVLTGSPNNYFIIKPGIGYSIFIGSKFIIEPSIFYERYSGKKIRNWMIEYTDRSSMLGLELRVVIVL
jgi:hypothetical protein